MLVNSRAAKTAVLLAAMVAAGAACSSASIDEDAPIAQASTNTAATSTAGAASRGAPGNVKVAHKGCSSGKAPKTHDARTVTMGTTARKYQFDAPANWPAGKPIPLVLALHPLLLNGSQMRVLAKFEAKITPERPFMVVYPDGIGNSWNAGECCGDAKDQKVDDVAFVKKILDDLEDELCVDETRVYSTGFSNGGFLSHRLACEMTDRFAAIAAVAGTLGIPEASCKPSRPIAVLQIHGDQDPLVPIDGGSPQIPLIGKTFGTFQAPQASVDFWRGHDRAGTPAQIFQKGSTLCMGAAGTGGTDVTYCRITGGGHQWPGTEALPAMGPQTKDIDATETVLNFLFLHQMP